MGLYADSREVFAVTDCDFYHAMDLPEVGPVAGSWDLRGRLAEYIGGVSVEGRRVLDLGAASGFCSFEMEKLGAEVVSFDADSAMRFEYLPIPGAESTVDYPSWVGRAEVVLDRLKNAYWLAHRLLQSQARACYGDIYTLPGELGSFDIVVVGQVLIHLRDPIAALRQAAAHSSETLVITEGILDSDQPVMQLCGSVANGVTYAWFQLSRALYREILLMCGFHITQVSRAEYKCAYPGYPSLIALTTIVASKK